jgi:hypothetical protein
VNTNGLKPGQYYLTPLQALLINRNLSSGVKLELEENFLKSLDLTKNESKRQKFDVKYINPGKGIHP